jgi:transcriptional regulator with XRE-family HTH domain
VEPSSFPTLLRERRTQRRLSQLDLALLAGTTQRHVSFMESGRSTPGRAMVMRLTEAMQLPLRERNHVLVAAGFAPAYAESEINGPNLAPVRVALHAILAGHGPYPAVVVGRTGELIATNAAFDRLVSHAPNELRMPGANAYRLALHPDGLGGRIVNLAEWGRHVLERIDQSIARDPHPALTSLRAELAGYLPPGALAGEHLGFAVPAQIRSPHGELRLITTVTSFATATDVTLAELKLEAFLPADANTATALSTAAPDDEQQRHHLLPRATPP